MVLLRVQRTNNGFTMVLLRLLENYGFTMVLLRVYRNKHLFYIGFPEGPTQNFGFAMVSLRPNEKQLFYNGFD